MSCPGGSLCSAFASASIYLELQMNLFSAFNHIQPNNIAISGVALPYSHNYLHRASRRVNGHVFPPVSRSSPGRVAGFERQACAVRAPMLSSSFARREELLRRGCRARASWQSEQQLHRSRCALPFSPSALQTGPSDCSGTSSVRRVTLCSQKGMPRLLREAKQASTACPLLRPNFRVADFLLQFLPIGRVSAATGCKSIRAWQHTCHSILGSSRS
jgi:hypothetical protein